MKRVIALVLLSAAVSPVVAADDYGLGYGEPAYPAPVTYPEANPWSRPYVGIFGGVAAGDFTYSTNAFNGEDELELSAGGLQGGIRVGYDYASSNFLVGAVADYSLTTISSGGELTVSGNTDELEARVSSLSTIRGRLGVTQKNNLYYVHGGAAIGTVDVSLAGGGIPGIIDNPRLGYTIGAGFEYAIAPHASIQTEYAYTDLGEFDLYSLGSAQVADHIAFHKVATGFNIRF